MQLPGHTVGRADAGAASLRRLHVLSRGVSGDLDLDRTLQAICRGVVDGLGFGVAVVNLVLPDGDLQVVACAGDEGAAEALLGRIGRRADWDAYLLVCHPVGQLLVDYRRHDFSDDVPTWLPDGPLPRGASGEPWDPRDALLAPMRTPRSGLLGVLSVDLPEDGCRPGSEQLSVLEAYAAQASVALENALLHTRLLEQAVAREVDLHRLTALVDSAPMAIVEHDMDGTVRRWNGEAERIFGWTAAQVLGRPLPVLPLGELKVRLDELRADGPTRRREARRVRRDGSVVDVEVSAALLHDESGQAVSCLSVYVDITERRALEQRLRAAAHTDPLTSLANRTLFSERLEAAAAAGDATVLLLDLDGFKGVNDTLGHAVGDRVLVEVAARMRAACRRGDLVARLGGDEFVVLLDRAGAQGDAAEQLAARLVEVLAQPFDLGARTACLGASIGVARLLVPGSADELLRDADVAMYAAKGHGKGRYQVFEPRLRAALVERTELTEDLRRALERGELFVRYHPVAEVSSHKVLGFEALVRWQHPTRGELAPAAFLPLAEEAGLVQALGEQVLLAACTTMAAWRRDVPGAGHARIGVNLSPLQLQPGLADTVRSVLELSGLAPEALILELTEDVVLEDVDGAVRVLRELRALGVILAIDDFGAGYSSLGYLKQLPVQVVKIDRSLLQGVDLDPAARALLDAVVSLIARLGMTAVAEGAETVAQWDLLEQLGCPIAQGFLLARPMRESEAPRLLEVGVPSSAVART
jgi:diguanylate cyclase (GGDEF)-like protein/PAS domain S-box-containing protein